jgi:hypothetical protein
MTSFDAYDLIALWERDQAKLRVAEKALLLLALARPGASREALGTMPIGARDRALFELRAALFGPELLALASCNECNEQLEVELHIGGFLAGAAPVDAADHASLTTGGIDLQFRLPTTDDALLMGPTVEDGDARHTLVRRCILAATRDGASVARDELGDEIIERVSEAMESLDPLSEIRLNLACSACESTQSVLLEITSYLWAELVSEAERLLEDVRLLAHEYGWREADILAMSGKRRQFYLDRRSV